MNCGLLIRVDGIHTVVVIFHFNFKENRDIDVCFSLMTYIDRVYATLSLEEQNLNLKLYYQNG